MISTKLLKELQQIIETDYGIALKLEEVYEIGNSLVGFFELLLEIEGEDSLTRKEMVL